MNEFDKLEEVEQKTGTMGCAMTALTKSITLMGDYNNLQM